jgi:AcrR family transcriptional regulator
MILMAAETKERILDTAERLFAEQGYAATSLRAIVTAARVNLAAIHYYFHSKETLLEAVIMRRADPVNRERLEMLDRCEQEAGAGPPDLEKVVEAFVAPTFRLGHDDAGQVLLIRLLGRVFAEGDVLPQIVQNCFGMVQMRFGQAICRTLPEVPPKELFWRMHFAVGAMAQALRGPLDLERISGGLCGQPDTEEMVSRLVGFLTAGFRAPVPVPALQDTLQEAE